MRVAILAWGSLLWDRGALEIDGSFQPVGPSLHLEFSRVSRNKRLTLVIDEASGVQCATFVAQSAHDDLASAIENMRARENMLGPKGIGFVVPATGGQNATAEERHPLAVSTIANWVRSSGYDAVIWTALASNFQNETSETFSVKAAIRHLECLNDPTRAVALNYIRRAPHEVQTPLRSAVQLRWPEDVSRNH